MTSNLRRSAATTARHPLGLQCGDRHSVKTDYAFISTLEESDRRLGRYRHAIVRESQSITCTAVWLSDSH
jgi:hypothetical protein